MIQLGSGDTKVQIGVTGDERLTIEGAQNMQNEPKSQNQKNQTKIVKIKEELRILNCL